MNRRLLGIAVFLLVAAMLASPVIAIGPWQAEVGNNPNLEILNGVLMLTTKGALSIRWHDDSAYTGDNVYRGRDLTIYRPATAHEASSGFKNTAYVLSTWDGPVWDNSKPFATAKALYIAKMSSWISSWFFTKLSTNSATALLYENKWIYLSSDYVYGFWFLGELQKAGFANLTPEIVNAAASTAQAAHDAWSDGVYYKYNDVN